MRTRYPHRQPKLACVSQSRKGKDRLDRSLAARTDVGETSFKHLRHQVAGAINEVVERHGHDLRLHPGTNKDCGIERDGTVHLGPDQKREQIGIATLRGTRNADVIWEVEERLIRQCDDQRRALAGIALERADDVLSKARTVMAHPELLVLRHRVTMQATSAHEDRRKLTCSTWRNARLVREPKLCGNTAIAAFMLARARSSGTLRRESGWRRDLRSPRHS